MIENLNFHNFGYLKTAMPEELAISLHKEADYIKSNFDKSIPFDKFLAGHIKHEYKLLSSIQKIEEFILPLTQEYDKKFNYHESIDVLTDSVPMCIDHPWINFQSRGEFNPVHNHKGIYSFVIWLKIPYEIENEFKVYSYSDNSNRKIPLNSAFQFMYVSSLGQIATHHIHIDKSFENTMILFPAKMVHCVYPFYTSDDFRISVAGNVMLKTA